MVRLLGWLGCEFLGPWGRGFSPRVDPTASLQVRPVASELRALPAAPKEAPWYLAHLLDALVLFLLL